MNNSYPKKKCLQIYKIVVGFQNSENYQPYFIYWHRVF